MLTGIDPLSGGFLGSGYLSDSGPEGEPIGGGDGVPYINGQLLIQFKPETASNTIDQLVQERGSTVAQRFYGLDNLVLVNLPWYNDPDSLVPPMATVMEVSYWSGRSDVEYAQLNRIVAENLLIPNDTFFPYLSGMHNVGQTGGFLDADIDMPEAWDIFTGSSQVVVAVIDSGVAYNHPDLRDNMWINPGEIPGNGIDDDGNGYVDDVYGIAPAMRGAEPGSGFSEGDPMDFNSHGTHVAGTIGAKGNNDRGVVGVNWDVQIMAINIGEGPAGFTEGAIVAGITYATMMKEQYGVNVVVSNNSWGGGPPSIPILEAFRNQIDASIVVVAASGNDDENNDAVPMYPSGYNLDGIISVGSSDHMDFRSAFSNYGPLTVDLFAPGGFGTGDIENILSTVPVFDSPTGYNYKAGTSMAAPHVAGVVALVRGLAPEMSVLDVKELILSTVDPKPQLENYVLSGGRLNAFNALSAVKFSTVEGTVWQDRNANGARDEIDNGIADWTVYVDLNDNGDHEVDEPFAVTDADGNYVLRASLAPGTYTVAQIIPPNWRQTYPANDVLPRVTINRRGDTITDVDFGNAPLPGTVSGYKWNDLNGNGVRDANEPGVAGVYIYADIDDDGHIDLGEPAAVTAADGSYKIHGIPAGPVAIREVLSPGWTLTYPALGYWSVTVIANKDVPSVNFGNATAADFGDAPAPYPTLLSQNGASAGILGGLHLGALIDAEPNGLPHPEARGDDLNNLADEDGVVWPSAIYAGTSATIEVSATATAAPFGYLQAWIDFNRDGDWNDVGEHIIVDRALGTGTHNISFPVPFDANVGNTFARFRFSLDRGVGTTGHTAAGEVEDYRILVLSNEPVANPDSYEVEQDAIDVTLDVLANDFPSASGVLNISAVTQPVRGNVRIATDAKSVIFTPNRGIFSPPTEVFTYTVDDGTGVTSTASVSVFVQPLVLGPLAVDDVYRILAGSGDNQLPVLDNDLPGVLGTMQITSVTEPGKGTATIHDNGTPADPLDDYIVYVPGATFSVSDSFQYTISNANGSSTATVTILEDTTGAEKTVDLVFDIQDLSGNPLSEVTVGGQFQLVVTVQDQRDVPGEEAGIYAAFLDVLYNRNLVSPVFDAANPLGFSISFGADYENGRSGDISTPGLLDEVGAFQTGFAPLGANALKVFSVVFTATAAGEVDFIGDPADVSPAHDILYFEPPEVVPLSDIRYGFTSLTIVNPGFSSSEGEGDPLDVNHDGYVTPIDALTVINFINRRALYGVTSSSNSLGAGHPGDPRVGVRRRPSQRAGGGFEDRLADVMAVAAVVQQDVQIAQRVGRHGLPEIFDQFAVERADLRRGKLGLENQEVAAAQIHATVTSVSSMGKVKCP
jgi:subtilisin family serine protease